MPSPFGRVTIIVCDSLGIGEMPDAAEYGDAGSDTLGHILASREVKIPNLQKLGLGNIRNLPLSPSDNPIGCYGRAALASRGKDTTTGHWEMAGIITETPFPTYPNGFPDDVMNAFETAISRKTLGNIAASGTEIIAELGEEHIKTGYPIVYTSADSVFQIAAHEEIIPIPELYKMCEIAREILRGKHEVGRVIARPFIGTVGNFTRTERRHDYAISPPPNTLLDELFQANLDTVCIGKISSIYCDRGVTKEVKAKNNMSLMDRTIDALKEDSHGIIFTNLVDFDMLFGHRNDVVGYAKALEDFDNRLTEVFEAMQPDDLLIISADHGCDPTDISTDHTREYVPVIAYGKNARKGVNLGLRKSLADIGQTIAENFNLKLGAGESFLGQIA
ncbi:MAG: phosphopentomutase [Blastocatellia bacterium]|nr:phosphopentomutase [Blastocatellia bacterium]MBL8193263.1 phosphopentomutase [Blastocatellia bacterium]MBN8722109.1 phosphopentomutase [Acidobacteriota bacterium]